MEFRVKPIYIVPISVTLVHIRQKVCIERDVKRAVYIYTFLKLCNSDINRAC